MKEKIGTPKVWPVRFINNNNINNNDNKTKQKQLPGSISSTGCASLVIVILRNAIDLGIGLAIRINGDGNNRDTRRYTSIKELQILGSPGGSCSRLWRWYYIHNEREYEYQNDFLIYQIIEDDLIVYIHIYIIIYIYLYIIIYIIIYIYLLIIFL